MIGGLRDQPAADSCLAVITGGSGDHLRIRDYHAERFGAGLYYPGMIGPRPQPSPPTLSAPDQPEDVPHDTPEVQEVQDVHIAPARLRELPAIAALQRRAFPPRLAYTLSTLLVLWALPWVRLLRARRNRQIVGVVIGDRTLEGGRVINLAVEPAAQRQGVGAALLHAIETALPGGDMTLMVQSGNTPARALYRRVGYADDIEFPDYYGSRRPGVKMRKRRRPDGETARRQEES